MANNKNWENIFHSPGKYFFETIVFYKPQIDPLAVFAEARNSEDKVHVIYGPRGKLAARAPASRAAVARTRATRATRRPPPLSSWATISAGRHWALLNSSVDDCLIYYFSYAFLVWLSFMIYCKL